MGNENSLHDVIGNWLLSKEQDTSNNSKSDEMIEEKLRRNSIYGMPAQMSHEGVFDFYKGRIESAPNYGLKSGDEILHVVMRCAFWDSFLTDDEYNTIINMCQLAHQRILELNWKETWKDEGQQ